MANFPPILLSSLLALLFISKVTGYELRHARSANTFLSPSGSCAKVAFDNTECGGLYRGNHGGCESYCETLGYSNSLCQPAYCLCHYEYNIGKECSSSPMSPSWAPWYEPQNPTEGTENPYKIRVITDPILITLTQKVIDAPIRWQQP